MTFKELRQQKNRVAKELKASIQLLQLKREENTRLKNNLENQIVKTMKVQDELRIEQKRNKRLKLRCTYIRALGDANYKRWMQDNKKISNWKRLCLFMGVINIAVIFMIVVRS